MRQNRSAIIAFTLTAMAAAALPAGATPPVAQAITSIDAGTLQQDGHYLWSWEICFGTKPSLSHFQLVDLCEDVWGDVIDGSIFGGTGHEFGLNPVSQTKGLKWEVEGDDGDCEYFGFETERDWKPGTIDVVFKSGQQLTWQMDVIAPSCEEFNPVPEPTSLALLGLGAPMFLKLRKKKLLTG